MQILLHGVIYDGNCEAPLHGEPFGGSKISIDLDNDDYIVKISGSIGWLTSLTIPARTIGKITFLTKKGKTIITGKELVFKKYGKFTLEPESGKQIFELQSSYSVHKFKPEYSKRYLDCLGITCMK
ncbi:hypothetical protein HGQ85_11360 [Clostridioides difficile]|nr:hypothetical protein [Clostridioides difficile]